MRLSINGKFDVEELELLLNPFQHNRLIVLVIYDRVHLNRAIIELDGTNHRVDSLLAHLGKGNECKIIRNESEFYFLRKADVPMTDSRPWTISPPFIHRPPRYIGDLVRPYSFPCILYKDSSAQFPFEVING